MKNLMIYINPSRLFTNTDWGNETDTLVKIQIDNSIALGWKREDIMLVTNFLYEYNGVKSILVGDENYCTHSSGTPSKILTILTLFEMGLIGEDIYWFHDFDCFQLEPITKEELGIKKGQIGITNYGHRRWDKIILERWSTGTIFFDDKTRDIFQWIKDSMYKYMSNEEVALLVMTRHNDHNLLDRINKLNISYNLATRRRDIITCYNDAIKPLRIIHFHPTDIRSTSIGTPNIEAVKPFLPERLINLFKQHGLININSCS